MDNWYDFVPVSFCKLLNEPAEGKKKLLNKTLHAFSRNSDMMSPEIKKTGSKK